MYYSAVTATFSAAHYLRNYGGKCENLHGHNWKVEAVVAAASLDEAGMGMDFTHLRQVLGEVLGELDHKVLNELPPFREQNPSSELLARHIFGALAGTVGGGRLSLAAVRVWESETSWAEYRPGPGGP